MCPPLQTHARRANGGILISMSVHNLVIMVDGRTLKQDSDEYKAMLTEGCRRWTRSRGPPPPPQPQPTPPIPQPQPQPPPDSLHLLDLPTDMLAKIFKHVEVPFVLKLACKPLRSAGPKKTKTKLRHVVYPVSLLRWVWEALGLETRYCAGLGKWAAELGDEHALNFLDMSTPHKLDEMTCAICARCGHLECLKWLWKRGVRMDHKVCDRAAATGQMEVLNWAWEESDVGFSPTALMSAAANGHEDIMYWLKSRACPFNSEAMVQAAANGQLATMKLLQSLWGFEEIWSQMGYNNRKHVCIAAATFGHVYCLAWAHEWGADLDAEECMREAARNGHVAVLQWIIDQGYGACDEVTVHCGAQHGHIEVLEWAREQGWQFNVDTTAATGSAWTMYWAKGLETLKWLREEGCPWDAETSLAAGKAGHLEMLKWLKEQNAPWHAHVFHFAAWWGHIPVLEWALETGAELTHAVCYSAAQGGLVSSLRWCMAHIEHDFEVIKQIGKRMGQRDGENVTMVAYIRGLQGWVRGPGCPVPIEWVE